MDTALGHDYAMIFSLLRNDNAYLRTFTHDYACYAPKHLTLPRQESPKGVASKIIIARITQFYSNYAVLSQLRSYMHNAQI